MAQRSDKLGGNGLSELNRSELEVLRILWDEGELKPAEIQQRFAWEIENPTLRSVLVGLVEKEVISREKRGKAYFYRAKARRRSLFSRTMRRMAQVFTGGSTAELLMQLLKQENLSPAEIDELRRLANEKATQQDPK